MSKITKVKIEALHINKSIDMECADVTVKNQFTPEWSAETTYGKMDPVATYSHTGRSISYDLVLLAKTLQDASEMQKNVDQLIKFQYPKYITDATGTALSAPPFFKVTFMDEKIYKATEGYFTAFEISAGHAEDVVPLVGGTTSFFFERKWIINFTMTVLHEGTVGHLNGAEPGGEGGFVFNNQALGAIPAPGTLTVEGLREFGVQAVDTWNSAKDALFGGGDD